MTTGDLTFPRRRVVYHLFLVWEMKIGLICQITKKKKIDFGRESRER